MHTIELLEEALVLAELVGYDVRRQWLGDSLGGPCRVGNQHILFVNLSLSGDEQLRHAVEALILRPPSPEVAISPALRRILS